MTVTVQAADDTTVPPFESVPLVTKLWTEMSDSYATVVALSVIVGEAKVIQAESIAVLSDLVTE